ncbi:MAG: PBP1b-binding outer membrane lipoprotein LpoB [Planctomycetota bacterium]|jgi:PBP1b-binding outer membrane lipoprotein LpoB
MLHSHPLAIRLLALLLCACAACAAPSSPSYRINLADVDDAVEKLMDEFETSAFLKEVRATDTRPGIAVDLLTNETDQRVNTDRILQTFESRVLDLRAFEVVSYENAARFKQALADQAMDWFDAASIPEAGNLYGFRYIIGGKLFGETERQGRSSTTEYRLVLKVLDVERGVVEWSETFDIRKVR